MRSEGFCGGEPPLDYIFRPRSTAIVGVSSNLAQWNAGQRFLKSLLNCGYKGKIYPVGLSGGEIFGLKIFPTIKDVPDAVDHVISAIPARYTPQLIVDCATKGVKVIQIFTAGFSEIGDEEAKQLESQITAVAHQVGIRIMGPNCMGLYCPKTGLSFQPDLPKESGFVGFISQSGLNSGYTVKEGVGRGVYFSKVISYGNACDLNESDFLEYLTADPETKIITFYIEGVKDGRRFFHALRQATKVKPVIVYKGGTTESGARATASHTGSIAGSNIIWSSLLKQAGAIQVRSIEELIDVTLLFTFMPPPKGKKVGIIGLGGGAAILATDSCSNAGLAVPRFPPEIRQRLEEIYPSRAGSSFQNPVDIFGGISPDRIQKLMRVVTNYEQIDLLFMHIGLGLAADAQMYIVLKRFIETAINIAKEINKPTAFVLHQIVSPQAQQIVAEAEPLFYEAGFPLYFSLTRAANAIGKFIQYYESRWEEF